MGKATNRDPKALAPVLGSKRSTAKAPMSRSSEPHIAPCGGTGGALPIRAAERERAGIIVLAKIAAAQRMGRSARVPVEALDELSDVLGSVLDAAYRWGTASTADGQPLPDLASLLREAADAIESKRAPPSRPTPCPRSGDA